MVSVADLLDTADLALHALHVPHPDVDVRWVATSELTDPAPFFEGGEILLTTGLQTAQWTREWQQYVDSLVEAGTVAIGLGIGLTYSGSPAQLLTACRQSGLNLFEVPRQTPFVAVSHRFARLLAEQEEAGAREALAIQRKLTAAAAQPDPVRGVAQALADALRGAAAIFGSDGRTELPPVGKRRHELAEVDFTAELHRLRQRGNRVASTFATPNATTLLQPIGVTGRRASVLAVLGPPKLTEAQRSAVITAVALLGLVAEQRQHAAATYRRLRRRAVELLVTDDRRTAELILGMDPTSPTVAETVRIIRASGPVQTAEDELAALGDAYIVAPESPTELCVVVAAQDAVEVAAHVAGAGMLVGIGGAVDADHASDSHRTAALALAQATSTTPIVEWEHVLRQGPLGLMDTVAAERFAAAFLGALDDDQVNTLRCFLRHHGSRLKVAEELGLHRNTVRNRLDAIEDLLPGSLDDPQVRASAWIALQAADPVFRGRRR